MWSFSKEKEIICININKHSLAMSFIAKDKTKVKNSILDLLWNSFWEKKSGDQVLAKANIYPLENFEIVDKNIFNITEITNNIKNFIVNNKIKNPVLNICLEDVIYETLSDKVIPNSDIGKTDSISWQKQVIKFLDKDYHYYAGIDLQLITQLHIIANLISAEINFISCPILIYCKILEKFQNKLELMGVEIPEKDINIKTLNDNLKEQITNLKDLEKLKFKSNDDTFFISTAMSIYFMEKHG